MSKVYYLCGLPLERLGDNVYCPRLHGRPSDTGSFGERTTVRRIPDSLLNQVDELLAERRAEWEKIREGVLNNTYTSPEIDLTTFQIVPRPELTPNECSQVIPQGVSAVSADLNPGQAVKEVVSSFAKKLNNEDPAISNPVKNNRLQKIRNRKNRHNR